jgi:hypothetical protein
MIITGRIRPDPGKARCRKGALPEGRPDPGKEGSLAIFFRFFGNFAQFFAGGSLAFLKKTYLCRPNMSL